MKTNTKLVSMWGWRWHCDKRKKWELQKFYCNLQFNKINIQLWNVKSNEHIIVNEQLLFSYILKIWTIKQKQKKEDVEW